MDSPQVESLAIIESVKNHPCLYDRRVKVSIRDKANKWEELGKLYGLSGHQMRTRWTTIKDKYILFKRRAEAYPETTLGKQLETYKYANVLTFLDDTIPAYSGEPPKNSKIDTNVSETTLSQYNSTYLNIMDSPQVESLAIIESVKNHPCLYDRRVKVSIRDKANKWEELGKLYGLSGHQMRTRWTTIKDKYILFKRRAEAYPETTLGKQLETYKYANVLTFLDDTIPAYSGEPPKNRPSKYVAMSKSWEKSHTLLLIRQLSHHPLLWDKSHPYYNHHVQRRAAYRRIAEVVKRYNSTVTPEMILKKIRTIRTQYTKENRDQRRKNRKPGAPFIPKLWFYNKLKFLDEKRTYDSTNLNGNATDQLAEMTLENFSAENYIENDHNVDGNDQDKHADDVDEEYNNTEEWISTNDSTRPFEQIQLCYDDEENVEREDFEGDIEEVFDQKDNIKRIPVNPSQTRSDLYVKCTGLLESLAKQIKPYEVGEKNQKSCKNCAASSLLGKMIESELANVSEDIFIDAKWKIIRILEEAQRKSLREKQDQMV